MKKLLIAGVALVLLVSGVACMCSPPQDAQMTWSEKMDWHAFHTGKSCDTDKAARQWVYAWNDLRLLEDDWTRFWLMHQPSMLNYYRQY